MGWRSGGARKRVRWLHVNVVLLLLCTAWGASAVETGTPGAAAPVVTPAPSAPPPPPPEAPPATTCGDGLQEGTEACEDGNLVRALCHVCVCLENAGSVRDL